MKFRNTHPVLMENLEAQDVFRFVTVASHFVKINQASIKIDEYNAPYQYLNAVLPPPVIPGTWEVLWHTLYSILASSYVEPHSLIREHGLAHESLLPIAERIFWPPYLDECPNDQCKATHKRLEKRKALCGYLYDLDGVKSVRHHTTYCQISLQNFYKYKVELPNIDCVFLLMLISVSIYNIVSIYNSSHKLISPASNHYTAEAFKPSLSDHCCSTALDLICLLRQFNIRNRVMSVSNSGAKLLVLTWMELEGSPYIDHMCSECTEILPDPNVPGGCLGLRAIAMDGITIGHPRCSATKEQLIAINPMIANPPACTVMLKTPKDRYCPVHAPLLSKLCHAQPCTQNAIGNTKACSLPAHIEAITIRHEKTHRSRAALAFNQRTGAKMPEDPTAALNADTDAFNLDALVERDESDRAHEAGRDGEETFCASNVPKKPTCSNAKTHNDLLFVATCGITLAQDTMYRAESVILVRESLERKFPVLPPIQFFDNSCTFDKSLRKDPAAMERLKGTIRPVDPFHMRTHSEKDAQCRKYNDPKIWPFLKKADGSWRFNGSAAEITNAWYGGFLSICRGMHEINYRFFLEEMIRVRNDSLLSKLVKKTNFCCNIPSHIAKQSPIPLSL
ncbi:hypothetical protein DFH28DRAFT_1086635 [Melampsora americana]|nr:hypothetical protein DFH28DRAFT_1086635 [Melampsora americana]